LDDFLGEIKTHADSVGIAAVVPLLVGQCEAKAVREGGGREGGREREEGREGEREREEGREGGREGGVLMWLGL